MNTTPIPVWFVSEISRLFTPESLEKFFSSIDEAGVERIEELIKVYERCKKYDQLEVIRALFKRHEDIHEKIDKTLSDHFGGDGVHRSTTLEEFVLLFFQNKTSDKPPCDQGLQLLNGKQGLEFLEHCDHCQECKITLNRLRWLGLSDEIWAVLNLNEAEKGNRDIATKMADEPISFKEALRDTILEDPDGNNRYETIPRLKAVSLKRG